MTPEHERLAARWVRKRLAEGFLPSVLKAELRKAGHSLDSTEYIMAISLGAGLTRYARARRASGAPPKSIAAELEARGATPRQSVTMANGGDWLVIGAPPCREAARNRRIAIGLLLMLLAYIGMIALLDNRLPDKWLSSPIVHVVLLVFIAVCLAFAKPVARLAHGLVLKYAAFVSIGGAILVVLGGVWLYPRMPFRVREFLDVVFYGACIVAGIVLVFMYLSAEEKKAEAASIRARVWAEQETERIRTEARREYIEDLRLMAERDKEFHDDPEED